MRRALPRLLLNAVGLPSAGPVRVDGDERARYQTSADALLSGDGDRGPMPTPIMPFLCWLAENYPVLFHGSARDDIEELAPIRLSRDASEFGNQRAVFATADPIWASWFAVVSRDSNFRGMRNASIGVARRGVFPRWYYFSVNRADATPTFEPGTLYILPSEGFTPERRQFGVIDTGQLVSPTAVRPIARLPIDSKDVPFIDCTVTYTGSESHYRTMLAFGRASRRAR